MSKTKGDIFIATESFSTVIADEPYAVRKDKTTVREGHPLVKLNPDYFKPIEEDVHFDLDDRGKPSGTSAPKEPKKPKVEVPDGVVPGETPGWPVDALTGEPLDLTNEQREELAKAKLEADPATSVVGGEPPPVGPPVDLSEKSRKQLDELACGLGVENPEKLPNKPAVIAAIEAAQASE